MVGIWYSEEGTAARPSPSSLYEIPTINGQCTNHLIASGPLIYGFNVPVKRLSNWSSQLYKARATIDEPAA